MASDFYIITVEFFVEYVNFNNLFWWNLIRNSLEWKWIIKCL